MTFDPYAPLSALQPDDDVAVPPALVAWLTDLALLRGVPLSYLVPAEPLLPAESIRFFHIDLQWIASLLDGALAAASVGTLDEAISVVVRDAVRTRVAVELYTRAGMAVGKLARGATLALPAMTGFVLRSSIVRRWPTLEVRAYAQLGRRPTGAKRMPILRQECVSDALMIAIVLGVPARVEIWEPAEGVRFGVEMVNRVDEGRGLNVEVRRFDDEPPASPPPPKATVGLQRSRVIDVTALAKTLADPNLKHHAPGTRIASSAIALALQQTRYVQVFEGEQPGRVGRLSKRLRSKVRRMRAGGTP